MRLKIKFGPNTAPVNRNSQSIVSWLHNVIGRNNDYHKETDKVYSVSEMFGGFKSSPGFKNYPSGGCIYVSTNDMELVKIINKNAWSVKFGDMDVINITPTFDEIHFNDGLNYFRTGLNGITLYQKNDRGYSRLYHLFDHEAWLDELNEQTIRRLKNISPGIDLDDFYIDISKHDSNKVVKSNYKNQIVMSNVLTLRIYGSVEVKKLLLVYGLGHLTGSGYGCIYPTEISHEYR